MNMYKRYAYPGKNPTGGYQPWDYCEYMTQVEGVSFPYKLDRVRVRRFIVREMEEIETNY